jgi:uncharacterized protein YuzE
VKLHDHADIDSLYIDLSSAPGVDSQEISENLVVDYGDAGQIVGLDIQDASQPMDLTSVDLEHMPLSAWRFSKERPCFHV